MNEEYQIVNKPLPLTQNYSGLKSEGIAFIEQVCGEAWTNLNETDPGITILEQLCFALTELGYCAGFPIEDLLTSRDGQIDFDHQFSHPQNILTTSPVTVTDYIKYIVDRINGIENVVFTGLDNRLHSSNTYKTLLPPAEPTHTNDDLINATWYALNAARNLDEIFMMPESLILRPYMLSGDLTVSNEENIYDVLRAIHTAINQFIFQSIKQTGYDELKDEGESINAIFDGPHLLNGWILNNDIKTKKDTLSLDEVTRIIQGVNGIQQVSNLSFIDAPSPLSCAKNELIFIDVFKSDFQINGLLASDLVPDLEIFGELQNLTVAEEESVGTTDKYPKYPQGNFRDVNDYYSIQNTMPEFFGVGETITIGKGDTKKVAMNRQLKAYLTLYDQVLANYFSQLANVGNLFSNKTPITGTPSDTKKFFEMESIYEREKLQYPVPYKSFSPTYFYQSLYETVPNIRPLLKNNQAFDFDLEIQRVIEEENESWEDYQHAPYNSYIHGLMEASEDSEENLNRRNRMLNHLLSRNGVSPELIDRIIDGTVYSGDSIADKILIKGAYLQNFDKYSYYRYKAYNFLAADKIKLFPKLLEGNTSEGILKSRQRDFIFDTELFDEKYKVRDQDLINYSVIELQLNLFFGLDTFYQNFILKAEETREEWSKKKVTKVEKEIQLNQVTWFMQERKGFILIEKNLLNLDAKAQLIIKFTIDEVVTCKISEPMELEALVKLIEKLAEQEEEITSDEKELEDWSGVTFSGIECERIDEKLMQPAAIEGISITIRTTWDNHLENYERPGAAGGLICVLPKFLEYGDLNVFRERLNAFFEYMLPVHLVRDSQANEQMVNFADQNQLEKLIPAFTTWHNLLNHQGITIDLTEDRKEKARNLVSSLLEISLLEID